MNVCMIFRLISFTKEFSELSAEEFCDTIIKSFRPLGFVVGKDFSVGKNRKGDVNLLEDFPILFVVGFFVPPPVALSKC